MAFRSPAVQGTLAPGRYMDRVELADGDFCWAHVAERASCSSVGSGTGDTPPVLVSAPGAMHLESQRSEVARVSNSLVLHFHIYELLSRIGHLSALLQRRRTKRAMRRRDRKLSKVGSILPMPCR